MELNFCWWNIGISPPIKSNKRDNSDAIELAKKYIRKFSKEKSLDVISLCEVSEQEEIDFALLADELQMDYKNLSEKVGRVILDFSIMYEMSKLEYISHKALVFRTPGNRSIRAGTRVVFKETTYGKHITLFLSHWPSRKNNDENVRIKAAITLRQGIDSIIEKHGEDSQFICMGDYNTHPYSDAMVEHLSATRDYHIIKNKRTLMFNPTWSFLSDKLTNNSGTYFHKGGESQRWHVIDQAIFSSSFIYGGSDCLKINLETLDAHRIFDEDNICLDKIFKKNFDHYPIFFKVSHEQP